MSVQPWLAALGVAVAAHGGLLLLPIVGHRAPEPRARISVTIVNAAPAVERAPNEAIPRAPEPRADSPAEPAALARPHTRLPAQARAQPAIDADDVLVDADSPAPTDQLPDLAPYQPAGAGPSILDAPMIAPVLPAPKRVAPLAAVPPATGRSEHAAYAERVRALVAGHKRYPERARRRGLQGEAVLSLVIAADGTMTREPRITRSSGVAALDREALRMARQAAPFPVTGAAKALEIAIPVHFSVADASR